MADSFGKSPLLQQLASSNAELTAAFAEPRSVIEDAQQRDAEVSSARSSIRSQGDRAQAGSAGAEFDGRRQILREQQAQLPPKRASSEIAAVAERIPSPATRSAELQESIYAARLARLTMSKACWKDQPQTGPGRDTPAC